MDEKEYITYIDLSELYEENGMKIVLEYQEDVAGQFDIIKIKAEEQ